MAYAYIGRIEPVSETSEIDRARWLALINSHGALSHVPPQKGINPFTRERMEVKAPASTAVVSANEVPTGSIAWAMDGSPILMVEAEDAESVESVATVAQEIAGVRLASILCAALGWANRVRR